MRDFLKITLVSFSIYLLSWIFSYSIGVNDLAIQSEDVIPAIFMPVTLIKEHTLYADTYYEMIRSHYPHPDDKSNILGLTPFYFKKVGSHYISAFPLISGLLAVPVYLVPLLLDMTVNWQNLIFLSHVSSAFIMALSGGFFYMLFFRHLLKGRKKSLIVTAIYLFGSINYALVSQALWQHGTVQLFSILALLMLYDRRYLLSGTMLGLAVLSRPTAAVIVPFISLLLLNEILNHDSPLKINKKIVSQIVAYIFGISLSFLFFSFYTKKYYLGIENNGYSSQIFVGWLSRFPEGFLGLWFSPSKGILAYSPIFIFSLVGIWQLLRNKTYKLKENLIYLVSIGIVLTHTLILGRWKHWYGGWSFGYRMASDIIPFLTLGIVPFLNSNRFKKLFWGLLIFSILVQIFGIIFYDGVWHSAYDSGFENTSWLWSLTDSEFVFNIRRILVKLGYLERACPQCL